MQLSELDKGSRARVCEVNLGPGQEVLSRRLQLMGIRAGAILEMVGRSPFGDPYIVKLNNHSFGLRKELLTKIEVIRLD